MEKQTDVMASAFTSGYPVRQQVIVGLIAVLESGTSRVTSTRKLQMRTALHAIIGQWVDLRNAGVEEKHVYHEVTYSAVGCEEAEDDERQLRDRLTMLGGQEEAAGAQSSAMRLRDDASQEAVVIAHKDTIDAEIRDIESQLSRRSQDIRFRTARALSDILEAAQWGSSSAEDGSSSVDLSGRTLQTAIDGMKAICTPIDAQLGRADYGVSGTGDDGGQEDEQDGGQEDGQDGDQNGDQNGEQDEESDASVKSVQSVRDKRFGKKRPDYTEDEDEILINIHLDNPTATYQVQANMHNAHMTKKWAQEGRGLWRERTRAAVQKRIAGFREKGLL
ncbi:uncharacterized protein LTR77_000594 [Saxophila tyrrhenica]|uniref:Uncharacterized protein n=1 Tax=Saxophila tyrrhenica TaxID=1690608 RepID=A0AAV9PPQ3_9PEZI|nr:hypothetical protein LTR77_000594 [Saxophila tyrrhenica]